MLKFLDAAEAVLRDLLYWLWIAISVVIGVTAITASVLAAVPVALLLLLAWQPIRAAIFFYNHRRK